MEPHGFTGRIFGFLMQRLNDPAYRRTIELLAPTPDQRFVEIGFGTGKLLEMMTKRLSEGRVAGVDPSRLMVETAKSRLARSTVPHDIRQGTAENLPWRNESFDCAAALHSFQFWPDPVQALSEIHRVLKPGGTLVLILRNHEKANTVDWLPNPWSRGPGEAENATQLAEQAGFKTRRTEDTGNSPTLIACKRQ